MTYKIEEIEKTAFAIGLSMSIVRALIENLPVKRSTQQNKALHVLFQNISFELNRLGHDFTFKGIKGMDIQITYTPEIVKDFIWKPLQNAMLSKSSTTELTTQDIETIFLILGKWFAENGVEINFPSIENFNK